MNKVLYEVEDNEGSNISVFLFEEKYWVDSEVLILKNGNVSDKKTKAIFGPFDSEKNALDSIVGKVKAKKVDNIAIESNSEDIVESKDKESTKE